MTEFRYKAFISYSHSDSEWAGWLLKSLERFKVPNALVGRVTENGLIPRRLAPVFRDRDELPAAGRMTEQLFEALQQSEFLIVLCSRAAARSKLVNREIAEFKRLRGDRFILCLIVDGVPFADDPEQECFPDSLLHSFRADGEKTGLSAEGLAADIRPEGDGKRMGLMKIIAGILGVGLNDIVQRDERRRQHQLIAWAGLAIGGLLIMAGLTIEAISARKEAEQAQQLAEAKNRESQQLLNENEELTHFLMTNIYEELLKIGSLDTLENISEQILAYYEKRDINSLTEKQIFSLTGARLRLGQMLDRRGDSARAEKIFEATLTISRDFYARKPDSKFALFRLSNNLFFTGYLAHRQGRLDRALADYEERLALVRSATELMPPFARSDWRPHWQKDPTAFWREKTADSEAMLTRLFGGPLRNPQAAVKYGLSSVAEREALADQGDRNQVALISLGSSYQYLGDAYFRIGQLNDAWDMYQKLLAIFDQLHAEEPTNYRVLRRYLLSQKNIALVSLNRGNILEALKLRQSVTEGFDILTKKDPQNTLWLAESAQSYLLLAETALVAGNIPAAKAAAQIGRDQIDEALARDNSRPARRLTGYRLSALEAALAAKTGQEDTALENIRTLLTALEGENAAFNSVPGSQHHRITLLLFLGDLIAAREPDTARNLWQAGVDTAVATKGTLGPEARYGLAQLYDRLERRTDAEHLLADLRRLGFSQTGVSR